MICYQKNALLLVSNGTEEPCVSTLIFFGITIQESNGKRIGNSLTMPMCQKGMCLLRVPRNTHTNNCFLDVVTDNVDIHLPLVKEDLE